MENNLEEQITTHREGTEDDVEDNLEEQVAAAHREETKAKQVKKQVEGIGNEVHGEPVHRILEDIKDVEVVSEYEPSNKLNSLSESSNSEYESDGDSDNFPEFIKDRVHRDMKTLELKNERNLQIQGSFEMH